ncbi:MAG TPA: hypothetical protein VFJ78_05735 [Gaiellaceae bacterium]|nr:hypothetical protein [Gaiellaceae bacterium]
MNDQGLSARAEFTRIYLTSLSRTAEREARLHGSRRAVRRLVHIHEVAAARGLPLPTVPPGDASDLKTLVRAATFIACVSLTALLVTVAVNGPHGLAVEVADLTMLVTATVWFLLTLRQRTRESERQQ